MEPSEPQRRYVAPAVLATASLLGIFAFHLFYAWQGFPIFRDQHLGAALIYARDGIDLLRPVIVGFNANNAPTPQEFPLWQAAASLPLRWFGGWFGWANIVSILLFCTALYPAYRLGAELGGRAAGWWTVALLLIQPLVWTQGGQAGTDSTCIAAAIWFFYCGHRALRTPRKVMWTLATAVTGALAATLKLPFMMAAGLALGILLLLNHRKNPSAWVSLGIAGAFAAGVFAVWTHHTDACIAQAEFPYVDLRLSHNPEMVWWYFGDWNYRLNPANWIKGGWRALNGLFGSFALVALPAAALGLRRAPSTAVALLAGAFAVTCIFSHLVLHHHQYFLMYSLPVALLITPVVSGGWARLESVWRWPKFLLVAALLVVGLLGVLQGIIGLETIHQDPYPDTITRRIKEHTSPQDKLLIVGGGWGGDYLFLSDREGLSIWSAGFLDENDNLRRLRDLGYTKLVLIGESPLAAALQMTNPGGADYQRRTYEPALSPASREWTTVHQDADLIIKQLPVGGSPNP
ncbi:MAG: glycosyltransferase family 39 protein [Chthoniobacterales bacterium]|nr:glycosyltransferase family 39 protein [Chthoniobacterales bacterium]